MSTYQAVKDLRTMRLEKSLDVFEVAEAVGLDPRTLAAVENGDLSAMEPLIAEWRAVLDRLPDRTPMLRRLLRKLRRRPVFVLAVLGVGIAIEGYITLSILLR